MPKQGGSTDGAVRSLTRKYDALGRISKITSHGNQTDDPDNTSAVANQILYTYDGMGKVTKSEQEHAGVVSSSPSVQYGYDASQSSSVYTNGHRLQTLTYPDGRVLFHNYYSADSLMDRLHLLRRYTETNNSGTIWLMLNYFGSGLPVTANYSAADLVLAGYFGSTYARWDRFGRVKDHRWWYDNGGGAVDVARYRHGYDTDSNRLYRDDMVAATNSMNMDELYAFDELSAPVGDSFPVCHGGVSSREQAVSWRGQKRMALIGGTT